MISLQILAPILGVGIGATAAYGATHSDWNRRIHFVKRENLQSEIDELDIEVAAKETCVECQEEISPDEIGAVVRDDGDYRVVCDTTECLDTYDLE